MYKIYIAAVLGFALGNLAGWSIPDPDVKAAIEQCQKELPRNQTCEIFAKPSVN